MVCAIISKHHSKLGWIQQNTWLKRQAKIFSWTILS